MPIKKTTNTKVAKTISKADEDALMEFEQFVSKPAPAKNKSWLAATLVIIIICLAAVWLFMSQSTTLEKDNSFKAVYLENGETYYAKVVKEDALNIYLDDVYYIQIQQQVIPAETEDEEDQVVEVPVLIKRGQEFHKPQGLMQINRSKLVAVEEIGQDSEIIAEINRINSQQQ